MSLLANLGLSLSNPLPPRRWLWLVLLVILLALAGSITVSFFVDNRPKDLFGFDFWLFALTLGIAPWGLAYSIRSLTYGLAVRQKNETYLAQIKTSSNIDTQQTYLKWGYPKKPKIWVWFFLLFLFLGVDIALTLLKFAQTPMQADNSLLFWGWALVPGFCFWGVFLSLRIGWYGVWQLHAAMSQKVIEDDSLYRKKMQAEKAYLMKSVLLGPACNHKQEYKKLFTGKEEIPTPMTNNVLHLSDVISEGLTSRTYLVAEYLAKQITPWFLDDQVNPVLWIWSGSMEGWSSFSAILKIEGCLCPETPHKIGGIEVLNWAIDRLYDEREPQQLIICAGLEIPEDLDTFESQAVNGIRSESAFALLLEKSQGLVTIGRVSEANDVDGLKRIKTDARLAAEVVLPFLSITKDQLDYAVEANWMSLNKGLDVYWPDTGSAATWISLLMACNWVNEEHKPTAWIALQSNQQWAGLVSPVNGV